MQQCPLLRLNLINLIIYADLHGHVSSIVFLNGITDYLAFILLSNAANIIECLQVLPVNRSTIHKAGDNYCKRGDKNSQYFASEKETKMRTQLKSWNERNIYSLQWREDFSGKVTELTVLLELFFSRISSL